MRPKSVHPLGIAHKSRCWGVWVAGRYPRNPDHHKVDREVPHLIISPIPPERWATSFHLNVNLKRQTGSLYRFLKQLSVCGVTIHFADLSLAGYRQAILNAVGEFPDMRTWREDFVAVAGGSQFPEVCADRTLVEEALHLRSPDHPRGGSSGAYAEILLGKNDDTDSRLQKMDAIRRIAFEWLGRRLVARLTALWLTIRRHENALWKNAAAEKRRQGNKDLDPPGEYYFSSDVVETGRRPWGLEIPWDYSWTKDTPRDWHEKMRIDAADPPDELRAEFTREEERWRRAPDFLLEELGRLADPASAQGNVMARGRSVLEDLYDTLTRYTFDAEWAHLDSTHGLRRTREARLAQRAATPAAFGNLVLERVIQHHWLRPLMSRAMYELGYLSLCRTHHAPLEFVYDEDQAQLIAASPDEFTGTLQEFWHALNVPLKDRRFPQLAIAAFHPRDRFIRLNFMKRPLSDSRIVKATVKYQVHRDPIRENENETGIDGRGLLAQLCKVADAHRIAVHRVYSRTNTRYPSDHASALIEQGVIDLVGESNVAYQEEETRLLEQGLRSALEASDSGVPYAGRITLDAKVERYQRRRVFWSTVFDHERSAELLRLVEEQAGLFGMEIVQVKEHLRPSTATIRQEIQGCSAVLQLICARVNGSGGVNLHRDEYVWLHTEYATAKALEKPVYRLLDEAMREGERDQFQKIDRDIAIHSINLSFSTDTLRKHLADALRVIHRALMG
jgi:hypothetical protein